MRAGKKQFQLVSLFWACLSTVDFYNLASLLPLSRVVLGSGESCRIGGRKRKRDNDYTVNCLGQIRRKLQRLGTVFYNPVRLNTMKSPSPKSLRIFHKLQLLLVLHVVLLCETRDALSEVVQFGQNTNFTQMTKYSAWFEDDPGNPLPWPTQGTALSSGNIALVSLAAAPGYAGEALASIGIPLKWDLGGQLWDDVKHTPVKISLDFFYQVQAYWTDGTGSGNAWLSSQPGGTIDGVGYETQETGQRAMRVTNSFNVLVRDLGDALGFSIGCQAHSITNLYATNTSLAAVIVYGIAIEFLTNTPPLPGLYITKATLLTNGCAQFEVVTPTNGVYTLMVSSDLKNWNPDQTLEGPTNRFVLTSPQPMSQYGNTFFRVAVGRYWP